MYVFHMKLSVSGEITMIDAFLNSEINPHLALAASESYESPAERAWYAWVRKVERLLGHDLDGHQVRDGYSLDFAYSAWEAGEKAEAYVDEVREAKAIRAQYRTLRMKYHLPAAEALELARKQLARWPALKLGVTGSVRAALGIEARA